MASRQPQDIADPLSLDLSRQTQHLLSLLSHDSPHIQVFRYAHAGNASAFLATLAHYMLKPSLTIAITWTFRPLVMDLCARWLDEDGRMYEKLEALALLIEIHEEIFPVISSFLRRAYFHGGPLAQVLKNYPEEQPDVRLLHRILLAYYRILNATPSLPRILLWDLTYLLKLFSAPHSDRGVVWLAIRCFFLQTGMSERRRKNLEKKLLGEIGKTDCPISYGEDVSRTCICVDGWMLPVIEKKRILDYRQQILESPNYFASDISNLSIKLQDLSARISNVHGILLLRTPVTQAISTPLVSTLAAATSLRELALSISLRRPTLLSSSPSSGKTTFLHHLASILHPLQANQLVTIYLADTSLDPRSLIGSYVSSTTRAGTFEWKDGVLVKAMREGKWVILKDIDRASNEVLGLLSPLVESLDDSRPIGSRAMLSIPNRGILEAEEDFALFSTRSLEKHGDSFSAPLFLGAQKWREIIVPDSSTDDLRLLVDVKYPKIAGPVADSLIDIWQSVKSLRSLASTRPVGIRDLEKICGRISTLLDSYSIIPTHDRLEPALSLTDLFPQPSLREDMYLEAKDVFFSAGVTNKVAMLQRAAIATMIGEKLGLSEESREWILKRRTPIFDVQKDADGRPKVLRAGRSVLPVEPSDNLSNLPSSRPFSMHKQAIRLTAQLAACVQANEPVLLTGETGTGKTSVISHLALLINRPLVSLNLSNQTESSDLIGGFKPVSARIPAQQLQSRFFDLFQKTFSSKRNEGFYTGLKKAVAENRWKTAVKLWNEAINVAREKLKEKTKEDLLQVELDDKSGAPEAGTPRKRRKLQKGETRTTEAEWVAFERDVRQFEVQHVIDKGKFAFQYVEGPLVKAIRTGAWVLLDEINLASPETLECISSLLQGPNASITLTERGSLEPVPRHSDFRLFSCMNPATDVGKKDLPSNIRARFTEIDVPPPDEELEVLLDVISQYIGHLAVTDRKSIHNVAQLYTSVKQMSKSGKLADGSDRRPHYSMRTLSRSLTFAVDTVQNYGLRRALWEGFTMAFTMVLNKDSADLVLDLMRGTLLSNVKNVPQFLSHVPQHSRNSDKPLVCFGAYWLPSGPGEKEEVADYILTPSVQKKLIDLARIIMTGRYPILIEGPTSSGKTSAIQYLARRTGHNFVRINNHEHTDIQEYLGSYVSDPKTGKLVFRDGLLVRALRCGDWIVLDELNLAPTDVLEALNRLLDDNRELVVPETQEVVRPHPNFLLFATQNPSGVYAGRKVLSRALRNRFLEVQFENVPPGELEHILCQKARIAPSYSHRIVAVFHELQKLRGVGRIFEGKEGFATLRDLFRWAGRDAQSYQELAENGYMLLAERTRHEEDKQVVKEVIEEIMKVRVDEESIYNAQSLNLGIKLPGGLVWTKPMRRLFILLDRALRYNEPVLLVGETGCGKTSVCQVYAETQSQVLRTVNCHQNTEAADIIGGLRPVRHESPYESSVVKDALEYLSKEKGMELSADTVLGAITAYLNSGVKLSPRETRLLLSAQRALRPVSGFLEWRDGPLVTCMRSAGVFLLDEISLADDSVLERLNSVLEPSRTLVLAERGGESPDEYQVLAEEGFKFVATMNPGGDFGKKELSPALRNRFTEIWVPSIMKRDDIREIIKCSWRYPTLDQLTEPILDFCDWITAQVKDPSIITLRDILSWINFCNALAERSALLPSSLFIHGGQMTIVDGLLSLTQLSGWSVNLLQDLRHRAITKLEELVPRSSDLTSISDRKTTLFNNMFSIGQFSVPLGNKPLRESTFSFNAPTSLDNAFKLIRACQITKPILLEGSPGVGKTSLVSALAASAGQQLCRINLSEQTDLVDLFGSDLPVDGNAAGKFAWNDSEFLKALKNGHWVLLDEMNLASQAVLEGLNAVFDHRGTVYIPELDRSFVRHPNFRVFAAQNPLNQGSGRKGLPKSFLNRFTKVFIEQLSSGDMFIICRHLFPNVPELTLKLMIDFTCQLHLEVVVRQSFGYLGSPWEFNLRDVIRWAILVTRNEGMIDEPWKHLNTVFLSRFRCEADRNQVIKLFFSVFGDRDIEKKIHTRLVNILDYVDCGSASVRKGHVLSKEERGRLLSSHTSSLESALSGISQSWLLIVTGPQGSGKTSFVRSLASICSRRLLELSLGSASDISDLIGGFEQVDSENVYRNLLPQILQLIDACVTLLDLQDCDVLGHLLALRKDAINASETHSWLSLKNIADAVTAALPNDDNWHYLTSSLKAVLRRMEHPDSSGPRFEWIDGPLVQAMKSGDWLVLDNANLCSPSVLDRLNSLCEIGGSLVLTEKGTEHEVILPHSDFRLIMVVDAQKGEISRAMRNRGIEVSLYHNPGEHDLATVFQTQRVPSGNWNAQNYSPTLRPSFEVYRRGLARQSKPGMTLVPVPSSIAHDALSSHVFDLGSLVEKAEDASPPALMLALLGSLDPAYPHHLLRLFKTLKTPNFMISILESLLCDVGIMSLKNGLTANVSALIHGIGLHRHQSVQPFLSTPYLYGISQFDKEACALFDILLEAHVLSSFLSFDLNRQSSVLTEGEILPGQLSRGKEAVHQFLLAVPSLLQATLHQPYSKASALTEKYAVASKIVQYARRLQEAATQDVINFSILYVISKWIQECIAFVEIPSTEWRETVSRLIDTFALTSGYHIFELWRSFYRPRVRAVEEVLSKVETAIAPKMDKGLVKRTFDAVAIMSIRDNCSHDEPGDWDALNDRLNGVIIKDEMLQNQSGIRHGMNTALLILELFCITNSIETGNQNAIRNTIHAALESNDAAMHYSRLIPYQQLAWKLESKKDFVPELLRVHIAWHEDIWKKDEFSEDTASSALLRSAFLNSSVSLSESIKKGRLGDVHRLNARLDDENRLTMLECSAELHHENLMTLFLLQSAAAASLASVNRSPEDVNTIFKDLSVVTAPMSGSLVSESTFNVPFYDVILRIGRFASLESPINRKSRLHEAGCCWILLSRALFVSYVPNLSLDPVAVHEFKDEFRQSQKAWIESRIRLQGLLEFMQTGRRSNLVVQILEDRLHEVEDDNRENFSAYASRTGDATLLHSFWTEVRSFMHDIAFSERVERLMNSSSLSDSAIFAQEGLLQDSLSNFYQRITAAYDVLRDLLPAIQLAVMQLRFGLSMIRFAAQQHTSYPSDFLETAMSFPFARSVNCYLSMKRERLVKGDYTGEKVLLLKLLGLAEEFVVHRTNNVLNEISSIYEQLSALRTKQISREEEEARQSQSLYRVKPTETPLLDEEYNEEQEIKKIFPIYSEDEEEQDRGKADVESAPVSVNQASTILLSKLHLSLFGSRSMPQNEIRSLLTHECLQLYSNWTSDKTFTMSWHLDSASLALRLKLLSDSSARFRQSGDPKFRNFYYDSNYAEASKAYDIVITLRGRLSDLIREWPDQLVLQHLRDRCDNISSINLSSPLAKILGVLERLILHIEDWEMFSNRENSLKVHQQSLTNLIVEWRRLELMGWRRVLESEAEATAQGVSDWWFRLYDVAVRGACAAGQGTSEHSNSLDDYFNSLCPLLESFITSSPLGQFTDRLHLIDSFANLTSELGLLETGAPELALERCSALLSSTHDFYSQFSQKISRSLKEQKVEIEKDIESLCQLATWRDVNIHALQQSAQRTHRQLYRRIRKFREVLRQPIVDKLQVEGLEASIESGERITQQTVTSNPVSFDNASDHQESISVSRLAISSTLQRFERVLVTEISSLQSSTPTSSLEDLSISIITAQEELTNAQPLKDIPESDRKIWNASVLNRKKRSWNDLLKELRRIGFAQSVKPDVVEGHRNRRQLLEQSHFDKDIESPCYGLFKKIDGYLYRSIGLLSDLIGLSASHHPDLSNRDFQRSLGLFESSFSYAVKSRARLNTLYKTWCQVHSCIRKLHFINSSGGLCKGVSGIQTALSAIRSKSSGLAQAMDELVSVCQNIRDLNESGEPIADDVLQDMHNWKGLSESVSVDVSAILLSIENCPINIITEGELQTLRAAEAHLNKSVIVLKELARRAPKLHSFCDSICGWLSNEDFDISELDIVEDSKKPAINTQEVVDLLLVIAQDLLAVRDSSNRSDADDAGYVQTQISQFGHTTRALRLKGVLDRLRIFADELSLQPISTLDVVLNHTLPYFRRFSEFVEYHLLQQASWVKSLFKLVYITGSVFRTVAQSGFCKPSEQEEESGTAEDGKLESAEGTGLGEGTGKENVSQKIEDESQYEGIKGQEDTDEQKDADAEADALDVDFDLSGDFEDGPERESAEEDGEDEEGVSNLDDEFANDIDDVDELKPVDEEFWGKQEEKKDMDEKDDRSTAQQKSEMVAKDEDTGHQETETEEQKAGEEETAEVLSEQLEEDQDEDGALSPDEKDVLNNENDQMHVDEHDSEDENRNVPDDEAIPNDGASDVSEAADEMSIDQPADIAEEQNTEDLQEEHKDLGSRADVHAGTDTNADASGGNADIQSTEDKLDGVERRAPDTLPAGNENTREDTVANSTGQNVEHTDPVSSEAQASGLSRMIDKGQSSSDASLEAQLPNPHRNLGDTLREVLRRWDEIQNRTDGEVAEKAEEESNEPAGLEYAPDNADDSMQALGPARDETQAKLENLRFVEEAGPELDASQPKDLPEQQLQDDMKFPSPPKPDAEDRTAGNNERLTSDSSTEQAMEVDEGQFGDDKYERSLNEDTIDLSHMTEIELNRWRHEGQPSQDGQRLWQLYDSLTQSLSYALCEQLRLILEPTKATRLMGDFRTGKRLNMKKIIPYIASNYTKDKIWLRRVRPSQREYQVLIAVDDSRSMAESHSIHLAFQTLALVSKALNRLEVGDLAIASFGESMNLLHGFEDGPFTDQTGTKVLEAFKFQQTATDVYSLLASSVEVLTRARERRSSSSSSDLWQLEIIISDGICQNHEELRALMRKAEEEHIQIVFIVIDARSGDGAVPDQRSGVSGKSAAAQNSIVNMNQAQYKMVNGRLELQMQRYLDSFPFEFFVILRNVESLPDVLSDTLRQFFERISAQ